MRKLKAEIDPKQTNFEIFVNTWTNIGEVYASYCNVVPIFEFDTSECDLKTVLYNIKQKNQGYIPVDTIVLHIGNNMNSNRYRVKDYIKNWGNIWTRFQTYGK